MNNGKKKNSKLIYLIPLLFTAFILINQGSQWVQYLREEPVTSEITQDQYQQIVDEGGIDEIKLLSSEKKVIIQLNAKGKTKIIQLKEEGKAKKNTNKKNNGWLNKLGLDQEEEDFKEIQNCYFYIASPEKFESDTQQWTQLDNNETTFIVDHTSHSAWSWELIFFLLLLFMLILSAGEGLSRRISNNAGGIMGIGSSDIKLWKKNEMPHVTFKDVAGQEEAKKEVMEFVDFLKNPQKYKRIGARIPRGALLVGPPGTGKTLLAKAIAGEANAAFFSASGASFEEVFVGVGSSRIRKLFEKARKNAPCIIFIDEIDALGGKRNPYERRSSESTLATLLVQMDGITDNTNIVILAATNRPESLDSALLRPGRFDLQIPISNPKIKDRIALFKLHSKKIKTVREINFTELAHRTVGFSGADIADACNKAAIEAIRKKLPKANIGCFYDAIDRVIGGLKKAQFLSPEEKKIVAYHEAGHTVAAWLLPHATPFVKATIIPHGSAALGFAQYLPKEQSLQSKDELHTKLITLLSGGNAELITQKDISTGAHNDIEEATRLATFMVRKCGFGPKLKKFTVDMERFGAQFYASQTLALADQDVQQILHEANEKSLALLQKNRDKLEIIAQGLMEKETITAQDVEKWIGPSAVQ